MPGLVMFRRRWAIGSDDMVVPAVLLLLCHLVQVSVLSAILSASASRHPWQREGSSVHGNGNYSVNRTAEEAESTAGSACRFSVRLYTQVYLGLTLFCALLEALIARFSLLGSVLHGADRRRPVVCLLYCRLILLCGELAWLCYGVAHLVKLKQAMECWPIRAMTAIVAFNWSTVLLTLLSVWCVFDQSGRVWMTLRGGEQAAATAKATAIPGDEVDGVDEEADKRGGGGVAGCQKLAAAAVATKRRRSSWKRRDALVTYEQIWDRRFRRFFCCLRDDRNAQATFRDIAKLFSDFFRDLDVVPTDILAGLVLLRAYQKERTVLALKDPSADVQAFMSGRPVLSTTRFFAGNAQAGSGLLGELVHYMKIALAAYGCPMLAYTGNCCCLLCQLRVCRRGMDGCASCLCCCCCCCCSHGHQGATARASVEALLRRHGVGPADFELLHVSQELPDAADCTPFYVGLDRRYGRLVVAIRGTLSLRDVLTDLRADAVSVWEPHHEEEEEAPDPRCPSGVGAELGSGANGTHAAPARQKAVASSSRVNSVGCSGHSGIVRAAQRVHQLLLQSGWLQLAAGSDGEATSRLPLLLTGHSLGAGIAAVLGLKLNVATAPAAASAGARVLAYSPPGGLLCPAGADACRDCVTSVVVGKDAVCRLGLAQLEAMRAAMSALLARTRRPKWRLICRGGAGDVPDGASAAAAGDEELLRCDWHSAAAAAGSGRAPLYLPGRILHLVRMAGAPPSSGQRQRQHLWRAVWADKGDFDELLVSPSMLRDHMPDCVLEALEQFSEQQQQEEAHFARLA